LPHALTGSEWLLLPGDRLASLAMDLGGLAFSVAIRTRIQRDEVLRLRRVLGTQRYAQVLAGAAHAADAEASHLDEMQGQLCRSLASDEDLASLLFGSGLAEWLAFVSSLHPAAVER